MSTLKLKTTAAEVQKLGVSLFIHKQLKLKGWSRRQFSRMMGLNYNYISTKGPGGDYKMSEIITMSKYLDCNLMELHLPLLPPLLRQTKAEEALKEQVAQMQLRIDALSSENAWLKEVVKR